MTAVVGLIAADGTIYMGGDSAGTSKAGDQSTFYNEKVFVPRHTPWLIYGVCGDYRFAQVLRYAFQPPVPPSRPDLVTEYFATDFTDTLRLSLRKHGAMLHGRDGQDLGGTFLVGYQGQLYQFQDNFQALLDFRSYQSIGSGDNLARGAMYATEHMADHQGRIALALEAAAHFSADVRQPFTYAYLPFRTDWYRPFRTKRKVKRGKAK